MSKSNPFLIASMLIALLAPRAGALTVTETFSYDGTYAPNAAVPPVGQTTWSVFIGPTNQSITPNSPVAGVASFIDGGTATNQRVAMFKVYSDPGFITAPANFEWDFNARVNYVSGTYTSGVVRPSLMGVRDEGGNGKTAMIGWGATTPNGALGFFDNTGVTVIATINGGDFRDGRFHDYRIVKFIDPTDSQMKVSVLIDGVPEGSPTLYSSLPDDASTTNGVGFFSNTLATSNHQIDEFKFGPSTTGLPTFVASYNGTYAPDSATPPLTQTTWQVFNNIGAGNIAPNAIVGAARFDDTAAGRLSIFDTLTDTPIKDAAWRFQTRLRIDTAAQTSNAQGPLAYLSLGVRDEGTAVGKTAMLGFFDSQLFLVDNTANINANSILLSNIDLRGGTFFHDIVVEKFLVGSGFFIQVYLDGVALLANPLAYEALPDSVGTTQGFGYFTATPTASNVLLDTLALQMTAVTLAPSAVVPEPATALLGAISGAMLLTRRRRHGLAA